MRKRPSPGWSEAVFSSSAPFMAEGDSPRPNFPECTQRVIVAGRSGERQAWPVMHAPAGAAFHLLFGFVSGKKSGSISCCSLMRKGGGRGGTFRAAIAAGGDLHPL